MRRYATAISRTSLSAPVQALRRRGLLKGSLLDYGCGKGDDVRLLQQRGVDARGFDPSFFPGKPTPADVVSLGYVLNVIEDQGERASVLRRAWKLAGKAICVAVRAGRKPPEARFRRCFDGWCSSTGTFQKFYLPGELADYIRLVLHREPEMVTAGIAIIYKEANDRGGLVLQSDGTWRMR